MTDKRKFSTMIVEDLTYSNLQHVEEDLILEALRSLEDKYAVACYQPAIGVFYIENNQTFCSKHVNQGTPLFHVLSNTALSVKCHICGVRVIIARNANKCTKCMLHYMYKPLSVSNTEMVEIMNK